MVFLEFEQPIAELQEQLEELERIAQKGKISVDASLKEIRQKILSKRKEIYSDLTPWQKVQVARHPERPYTLDYLNTICDEFEELHGDRHFGDDKAIIGALAKINDQKVMIIGHQKGSNTKLRQYRNFGMANPEGYRKALRLMRLAEKFDIPIVTLIDTPGAYPGIEAEERGQAEAIARNLYEMVQLKVPVMSYIIGEGASGGALGIGVADRLFMLEYTWFSVISPEGCASILWRSADYKESAADSLKLTSEDMLSLGIIDEVVKEPVGGAHSNKTAMESTLKDHIIKNLDKLKKLDPELRIKKRIERLDSIGRFTMNNVES
ncbi:MAG: acetyl-CoA carboxylase carboxyltransferase subunit alpha [Bacteroidetes bacterium]|nr:acetyl-CoA carboxylase carboxyltransferase subunit alpha [Bacteroidota bacterium]